MHVIFHLLGKPYRAELNNGTDISIPLESGEGKVSAWYVPPISIEPVKGDGFVGSVAQGGSVNFRNISFNPHGHGTHTECLGHITETLHSVNQKIKEYHLDAQLITVHPTKHNDDLVIEADQIPDGALPSALILRTSPNTASKLTQQYSDTNPPYLSSECAKKIVSAGVRHLLIDLPSVDREVDGGELRAHHIFWQIGADERHDASITEMVYVPDEIRDGYYFMNLQFPPFENDASPSRPIIYPAVPAS
ncbi:cyclase family protein [Sanyastnella coralliicola]|uniref:cyclase family protein n=1 Tax=Sanyastnella coralliicola TaxID=3069118 RepID=UPI0027B9ECA0|nr:cyclase family protein [Longitalea sp. SCSIO 12813]